MPNNIKTKTQSIKANKPINIFSKIDDTNIIHQSLKEKIKKLCGERILDVILHTPCNYELYKTINTIAQLKNGDYCCVELTITNIKSTTIPSYIMKKKHIPIIIQCKTFDGYHIDLVFFNFYPQMMKNFFIGKHMVCYGKIKIEANGKYSIIHPHIPTRIQNIKGATIVYKMSQLEDNGYSIEQIKYDHIYPIYKLIDGLKQTQIITYINKILNNKVFDLSIFDKFDYLYQDDSDKNNILPTFKETISKLHNPDVINNIHNQSMYRKKMSFLELLSFKITLSKARVNKNIELGNVIHGNGFLRDKLLQQLPFNLTDSQIECLNEIYQDQGKENKMFRLLQGDVGSGKTIVSLLACLNCVETGKKAIIMAPTSILARQHFTTINKLCSGLGIRVELLIGETKTKARKDILSRFKLGMIDILVGTHTLFQKNIELSKNIGLFVIDEQHNFGVEQRINLINKSGKSDVLMMSATPIPRTMVMALYGDIKISKIKTKPLNRLPIETKVISIEEKYQALVEAINRKVKMNEKIYWVCPLVEESEKLDYIDVKTRMEELSTIIDKSKIGLIHGKMSQDEKDKTMLDFKNGIINILVATSVIEVGIDVPDATIIVIENAEKFGLSQLHQLRGRVGRGEKQSYCFLLYGNNVTDIGKKRLEILKKYDDGFLISEADLNIRGGGAILSKKQSGFNSMRFVNFVEDKHLINNINNIDIFPIIQHSDIKYIIELFNYKFSNGNDLIKC